MYTCVYTYVYIRKLHGRPSEVLQANLAIAYFCPIFAFHNCLDALVLCLLAS